MRTILPPASARHASPFVTKQDSVVQPVRAVSERPSAVITDSVTTVKHLAVRSSYVAPVVVDIELGEPAWHSPRSASRSGPSRHTPLVVVRVLRWLVRRAVTLTCKASTSGWAAFPASTVTSAGSVSGSFRATGLPRFYNLRGEECESAYTEWGALEPSGRATT
jgi:hypothetical protein